MKIEEVLEKNKNILRISFVDIDGNVYYTHSLHEMLAQEICDKKGWDWYNYYNLATDFLLFHKAFIKIANHASCAGNYHYVSYAEKFKTAKKIRRTAKHIADALNVPIIYEEETS